MKMNKFIVYIFIAYSTVVISCGKKQLPSNEYIQWMEDEKNGLRKSKESRNIKYIFQYKTANYVQQKRNPNAIIDPQILEETTKNAVLFDLYITCKDGTENPLMYNARSKDEIDARFAYYHFGMEKDIWLEIEDKKIYPMYCDGEKSIGFNNVQIIHIGFDRKYITQFDFKLVLDDTIFGNGLLKFSFKEKDLENIPELKI